MPYVPQYIRQELHGGHAKSPGGLNYQITRLLVTYIDAHGLSYQTINDILGALTGAQLEFYRRVAAPYEDGKIIQNGDVYHETPIR